VAGESPPLPLAYDELPVGSDLRREYSADGAVTITAPAGEPSAAARRAAAHSTGLSTAALCALLLVLLIWPALPLVERVRRLDAGLRPLVMVLLALFVGGVFLLVWKVRYGAWLDLMTEARREAVILHADRSRLLIEIAGPNREQSFDLRAERIRCIRAGGAGRAAPPMAMLTIEVSDGSTLALLVGRHRAELSWVASTVRETMGLAPAPVGQLSAGFSPR
jgi:hypothetical protein